MPPSESSCFVCCANSGKKRKETENFVRLLVVVGDDDAKGNNGAIKVYGHPKKKVEKRKHFIWISNDPLCSNSISISLQLEKSQGMSLSNNHLTITSSVSENTYINKCTYTKTRYGIAEEKKWFSTISEIKKYEWSAGWCSIRWQNLILIWSINSKKVQVSAL